MQPRSLPSHVPSSTNPSRSAIFLDRDDTILNTSVRTAGTSCQGDLKDPALVELLPGVAGALAALQAAGFGLVVLSNQGAVARGHATLADVELINDTMRAQLAGTTPPVTLGGCYYCPFHPQAAGNPFAAEHPWRKPAGGMFTAAGAELNYSIASSWAVGDKPRDLQAAIAAGFSPARCILLNTSGAHGDAAGMPAGILLAADLPEAASVILGSERPKA